MPTGILLFLLSTLLTATADPAPLEGAYVHAADAIILDPAATAFLRRDDSAQVSYDICVAESLYTLDRFPFDTYPGDSVVSVYKADMLRPVRAFPVSWPARFRRASPPSGMLFLSRREDGTILAELFAFNPLYHSYEEYCIASDSLKFLLRITRGDRVVIAGRVRLLR